MKDSLVTLFFFYKIYVTLLSVPRHRWRNNIKMDIQKLGWGSMKWVDLAQDMWRWRALVSGVTVMNVRVP
jgi:hypothetical protein